MLLIPYRTDRPRLRPAYLTILLIVACTVIQILGQLQEPVVRQVEVGGEKLSIEQARWIVEYGLWGSRPTLSAFFTHMFLHGGWLHLIGNMLFLWIFGSLIEDAIRPWGLAALYLLGGLFAALAHIGISAVLGHELDVPMVGASGAIAAIMGLFILRFYRTRVEVFYVFFLHWGSFSVASVWALLYWIVLEVFNGVLGAVIHAYAGGAGGVAHWAHVGGFLAGAAFAPFLGSVEAAKREYITDDPETNVEYLRRSEQVAAVEKVLAADPGNAYQIRRLAQALRHAGEYERASRTYEQCIQRFATRGMVEQAAEVYLELLAYNDAPVLSAEALLKVAKHLETEHLELATDLYYKLATEHVTRPEGEWGLLRLSMIYAQSYNRHEDAYRCLTEFLQRYPNSQWAPEARRTQAILHGRLAPQ